MTGIQLQGLTKRYGSLLAVDGLSLTIGTGETFGLLGPNGAGKTTTLSMLVGLLEPDTGSVQYTGDGEETSVLHGAPTNADVRRKLGIAPQSLSLYEDFSAYDNLLFFAKLYGLRGKALKERVHWALEFARLHDRRNDRVATFSGGMKRRLNIAVALVHDPSILLLDEPTVGVDPQSRNHIFDCIEELQRAGLTIVYTTHYMEEAQRLCSRVGIIDHGKLLACDTVPGLIRQYGSTSSVRAELGRVPSDVSLPGTVVGNELRFEAEDPFAAVEQLRQLRVEISTLQVTSPTLESVFLSLTGRSLRD